ncbi:putative phosphonoacetaldehyde dehydrogenase [Acidithiobacillus ferrivorans]|uniref:Phosphonoacetaldehyde dehydrogenase n=1 Tax=Acidithiobacillus ferrivorans TaxID=160808 RepID=A0A060UUQ9_9PROT|nr:aldehyde dehydrogenase family protein [Acidithiobacillus ferrivorans]CDQ10473.1 putative phosphonoacetaldehyde dehydrogenase [Acidithiobacillus ferrivorans]SMH64501.1 putative phosphonoacetaldehyde dehydrogenase [Acidithiobacillus ferrivorans]
MNQEVLPHSQLAENRFKNTILYVNQHLVDGNCLPCNSIIVRHPFSHAIVAAVPLTTKKMAIGLIHEAAVHKANFSNYQKYEILSCCISELEKLADTAASIITLESGLSLQDSYSEVNRVLDVFRVGAASCLTGSLPCYPGDIGSTGKARTIYSMRVPLEGVILAITPFNHPMNQIAHKVVPAFVAGTGIIVKPSEKTPLSALFFESLLRKCGVPPFAFSLIHCRPGPLLDALLVHKDVNLIAFTGSVGVGKYIAQRAGYRRIILELGGNDSLIVLPDADLEQAAVLAAEGAFRNSGQRCTAVKRILVPEKTKDAFLRALCGQLENWAYGNPFNETIKVGTVIDTRAADEIEHRVSSAIAAGATLCAGGRREGALMEPTVLSDVQPDMLLVKEETFGPIAPVLTFRITEDAIEMANATPFGLSCGICTNDFSAAMRIIRRLHVGNVNINEVPGFRTEYTPFGGIRDSGLGYKEGIAEAVNLYSGLRTYSFPTD